MPKRRRAPRAESWKEALERARLGVWDWNLRTGECFYSASWTRMLGYADGELTMSSDLWMKLAHPDDLDRAIASGDRHIAGLTENIETELRLRHKNGSWVWVLDRGGIAERDAAGKPVRVIGVQTDITKQKLIEHQLEQINTRFELALAASGTGIWHHDLDTHKSFWDKRTRAIFGIDQAGEDLPQDLWHSFLHPEDRERAERAHSGSEAWKDDMSIRYRIVRRDGQVRFIETFARHIAAPGSAGRLVGTTRDVTEEVKAAETLGLEKERLRVTLRSISDAVVSTDMDGRINFVNHAATEMVGKAEAELLGLPVRQALGGVVLPDGSAANTLGQAETIKLELTSTKSISVRCTASPILSADGSCLGTVHTLQDVSDQLRKQRELAYAARHDALTGMLNRSAFDELLAEWIAEADRSPLAVLYLDLDYFKALNDLAGHAAGDRALKSISTSIRGQLPAGACFARLGGDEFAALVPLTHEGVAETVAEAILLAVKGSELGPGVPAGSVGVSIGIVVVTDSCISPADALACADDACYVSKAAGRNRYSTFANKETTSTSGLNAARIAADILEALDEGRLHLYGQEIHALSGSARPARIVEVLARLVSKGGTIVPPAEFIPAAERFGIAAKLDRWIIKAALTKLASATGAGELSVTLNLSAQTLSDPHLLEFVGSVIEETGVSPRNIVFEVTETAAVTNFEAAERFIRSARERGCRVSLDDFGAGLSSFEYLRRFPIDSIKINGSFVQNMAAQRFDREIVASINAIAKSLGYSVVAEKIDNPEALSMLRAMGADFGQGFLLHRPEPLEQLLDRLAAVPGRRARAVGTVR